MTRYVLDASALLALLNNEPGAQRISDILPESVVGTVNLCETIGKLVDAGMSLQDAQASIGLLNLDVVPFDSEMAYKAGALIAQTKKLGLSLGDRACLALGLILNSRVVTAERLWSRLQIGIDIEIIRGNAPALPGPDA